MKLKRVTALVLAVVMLMLSGCSKNESTGEHAGDSKYKVSDKLLELSYFYHYGNQIYDIEWPTYKKAQEFTNVKLNGVVSKMASDWNISFNTMISSKPLPDIIWNSRDRINQYALLGGFVPLDELIEKYAPNIKRYLDENPDIRKEMIASDGKLYFIPNITEQRAKEVWFIRQDWLDNLRLQKPTTVDELYNAAKSIANGDPNGNGLNDEIPIFGRAGYFQIKKLLNLYGVKMQEMRPFYEDNGEIKFAYMDETFKNAVTKVSQWYKEGLIDPEIYTRKDARTYLLSNNLGGITSDFHGSNDQMNQQFKDIIEDFKFEYMPMPKDINGEVWDGTGGYNGYGFGWGISVDNKQPEETMKYFDFWFTEDGKLLNTMGIEGVSYTMADGIPTYTEEYLHGTDTLPIMMDKIGANQVIGGFITFDFNRGFLRPELFEKMRNITDEVKYLPPFPNLPLSQEELTEVRNIMNAIYSFTDEKLQKWVLGSESIDAVYDDYLRQLNTLGIEKVLDIYNRAYKDYLSSK